MTAGQTSEDAHQNIESNATLADIEATALGVTLGCLRGLNTDEEVFDQCARSAEALMRIALHAMAAQRQNQKDARDDAERFIAEKSGDAKTEISDEQTRKLAKKLNTEFIRLSKNGEAQPTDNRAADSARGAA